MPLLFTVLRGIGPLRQKKSADRQQQNGDAQKNPENRPCEKRGEAAEHRDAERYDSLRRFERDRVAASRVKGARRIVRFQNGADRRAALTADGDTIASLNPDRLLMPASNMKLVTTGLALDFLGENFVDLHSKCRLYIER